MGIFDKSTVNNNNNGGFAHTTLQETAGFNRVEYRESVILDELCQTFTTQEQANQFLQSPEFKAMCEAGILTEALSTTVVMSKFDDLTRRTKLAALQLAKDSGDADYDRYLTFKQKERELEDKMMKRYSTMASREAKKAQKDYIKEVPNAFRRRVTIA